MRRFILKLMAEFPAYLWSGWGAIASIFLFLGAWDIAAQYYLDKGGALILPSPKVTIIALFNELSGETIWPEIYITTYRAFSGFIISLIVGSALGLSAGLFSTAAMLSRPIITMLLGMPPIAWIVLAMIWFGMGDASVIFTVFIACFPIVFVGALQGTRTIAGDLKEMVDSFQLPRWQKFSELYFPHIFSYIFPAWIAALGMSWKIVIMAELLASDNGLGATLAVARSQLDTPLALAVVLIMISTLLVLEYILLEPLKREVEAWRS